MIVIRGGWIVMWYYGEQHLVPACDERMHTIPMCWCPLRIRLNTHTMVRLYEHFSAGETKAIQERKT